MMLTPNDAFDKALKTYLNECIKLERQRIKRLLIEEGVCQHKPISLIKLNEILKT